VQHAVIEEAMVTEFVVEGAVRLQLEVQSP
jgi:hypothetical protein